MNLSGILSYVSRAARFSLIVCAVYAAGRAVYVAAKRRSVDWRRELVNLLFVAYFAALAEIIALRGGPGSTRELRPVPLRTTIGTMKEGLWPFVYNLVGNLLWFVPLGMFLRRRKLVCALLAGAAVSLFLETLQWLLMTGVTDIDDVILNALGAAVGNFICGLWNRKRKNSV